MAPRSDIHAVVCWPGCLKIRAVVLDRSVLVRDCTTGTKRERQADCALPGLVTLEGIIPRRQLVWCKGCVKVVSAGIPIEWCHSVENAEPDQAGDVSDAQLLHQAAAIGLHRLGREGEYVGYGCAGLPLGDELEDFSLARGEARKWALEAKSPALSQLFVNGAV